MSITIKDVAREAGVSTATVSKVINGKPSISDATRQHVCQVMECLNYHPNAQASNFARKKTNIIVFLTVTESHTAFDNPHMFEILCGAQSKIREKNYHFSFIAFPNKEAVCREAMNIISRKAADGLIVHGSATSRPLVDFLTESAFPHIIIGRPPFSNTACWIDINNHVSGEMAAKYLNSCGYSKIAFIGGPATDEISRHRLKGFTSSMQLKKLPVPDSFIKYGSYSKASGFQMMEELLRGSCLPDAVICENNQIAMGAVSAIEKHGMSIPDDIGVITFDDYPLSQLIDPPLTVVDIDVHEMGRQAASILLKKIKNPQLHVQSFATLPSLIVRSSLKSPLSAPILPVSVSAPAKDSSDIVR
ncbi:MAG: LacI family transcriptional regulator [Roseburia sp.]|nr:LacI family transcriptional regulator [Roseburia sp.]MCM1242692.1 LacI family transcriptional regulator [Roseburia sp.]